MKEILQKIVDFLKYNTNYNKEEMIAIVNPLKTEKQAITMLNYLEENKDNKELMRIDKLLKKALAIEKEEN